MSEFKVTPIFDYPYCCLCFERLGEGGKPLVERADGKWNVCHDCEEQVFGSPK